MHDPKVLPFVPYQQYVNIPTDTYLFFTPLICPFFQLKFTHLHFSGNAEAIDIEHIKVGSFYEIDHSKLTPQTPDQLRPIRVAMVHIIQKCQSK